MYCNIAQLTDPRLAANKLWKEVLIQQYAAHKPSCPIDSEGLQPLGPPNMGILICTLCEQRGRPFHFMEFDGEPRAFDPQLVSNL